jgi:hypothetical protein
LNHFLFLQIFPIFGRVTKIEIDNNLGKALVTYANIEHAFKAKLSLHKQRIERDKAWLEVILLKQEQKQMVNQFLLQNLNPLF